MGKITLVTGGAASGKSEFGEELIAEQGQNILYIATGQATDGEMVQKIARHRQRRLPGWETREITVDLGDALADGNRDGIILDCLTGWATNILFAFGALNKEELTFEEREAVTEKALGQGKTILERLKNSPCPVVIVTNEIGMSLVPADSMSRFYRDFLGQVNQLFGAGADEIYLVISGTPLKIKG